MNTKYLAGTRISSKHFPKITFFPALTERQAGME
jgi:hypothetical protein